jgi:hypothetical protein
MTGVGRAEPPELPNQVSQEGKSCGIWIAQAAGKTRFVAGRPGGVMAWA